MDKNKLRKDAIQTLKDLNANKKKEIESKLAQQLLKSEQWQKANTVGITLAQGFEWDTKSIIEAAWREGKRVCAPKCTPKGRIMTFYQFTTFDQLEVVYYDLLEPKAETTTLVEKANIDLIIVPGVLFDKKGYRIGFGGGYYDRYLAGYEHETVALVSQLQLVDEVPSESFDIPVAYLVTEDGIVKTN